MFGFIKKMFFVTMTFFSFNSLNINSLECVSMNNQECKIRSEIINVNTNESFFVPIALEQINAKAAVILLIAHLLSCVFLVPLKT